jgi:putative ABC transport system permease protein
VVAGSVLVGLVAALLPALRASRMNVLAAIAHE